MSEMRRLLKPPTLDFETAIWEICYLFIAPKKVYRQMYYRVCISILYLSSLLAHTNKSLETYVRLCNCIDLTTLTTLQETKNTWARDDPSFVLLLSGFLMLSAVAWGIAYSPGFIPIVKLMANIILIDFLAVGAVISTVGWLLVNKFFRQRSGRGVMSMTQNDAKLEWA